MPRWSVFTLKSKKSALKQTTYEKGLPSWSLNAVSTPMTSFYLLSNYKNPQIASPTTEYVSLPDTYSVVGEAIITVYLLNLKRLSFVW